MRSGCGCDPVYPQLTVLIVRTEIVGRGAAEKRPAKVRCFLFCSVVLILSIFRTVLAAMETLRKAQVVDSSRAWLSDLHRLFQLFRWYSKA